MNIKKISVVVLSMFALFLSYLMYVIWDTSPVIQGKTQHTYLVNSVEVRRDAQGVPSITAKTEEELFYAQGYVHAQDRMFQMLMLKHLMSGRMSEIFGARTEGVDRYMRVFNVQNSAESSFPQLDKRTQSFLRAYAEGINRYMEENRPSLEERLLGFKPGPWQASDALIMQKAIAFDLSKHWPIIIKNSVASSIKGTKALDDLYPDQILTQPSVWDEDLKAMQLPYDRTPKRYKDGPELTQDFVKSIETFGQLSHAVLKGLSSSDEMSEGSNAWAISPSRSSKNAALLANDPHLTYTVPSTFYLIHLKSDNLSLSGASIPGAPGLIIGRNDQISWGFTNSRLAQSDVYYAKEIPGGRVREEVIKVKGAEHLILPYRDTDFGTVVSTPGMPMEVAIKWTGMAQIDNTLDALIELNFAKNLNQAKNALMRFESPAQNAVVADSEGNYGFYTLGNIPIRNYSGRIAVPAEPAYRWQGYIPKNELPYVENPPRGYVMNANNHVASDHYGYNLSRLSFDDYRAIRLNYLLRHKEIISPTMNQSIQLDSKDMSWVYMKPALMNTKPLSPKAEEALEYLSKWSGMATLDSFEQTIFATWQGILAKRVYANVNADLPRWASVSFNDEYIKRILTNNMPDCQINGECDQMLSETLDQALEKLTKTYGNDMQKWTWRRAHRATFKHAIFKGIPVINKFANRYLEAEGARDSVNRSKWYKPGVRFYAQEGASLRMLIDMSKSSSRLMIPMGESGHLFSSYYDNLNPLWTSGQYVTLPKKEHQDHDAVLEMQPIEPLK